jgi:hypothetical protein
MNGSRNSVWIAIVKAAVAGLLYVVGAAVSGMIAGALHVAIPNMVPANVNPQAAFRAFAMLSPLLGIGLLPLALGCSGGRLTRGLALSFLMFVTMGLNEVIELRIFSTAFVQHGAAVFVASAVLPAALCGLFLGFTLSGPASEALFTSRAAGFFNGHSAANWSWRFALAVVAFPVVYFVFGAMVAPIVVPTYRAGIAGLVLPPLSVIMPVQVLRSSIFLLSSLPFLFLWIRSRRSLVFALGFHWFAVTLFGLAMISWFPAHVRIAHLLEGAADSFVYAAALVYLLMPRGIETPVSNAAQVAPMFPS